MKIEDALRNAGLAIVSAAVLVAVAAPLMAPHDPGLQFRDFLFAPPMRLRLVDADGRWHAPFAYPLRLTNRLERRFEEDRSRRLTLAWLSEGKFTPVENEGDQPVLLLGADGLGRDILARVVYGARASLAVAFLATAGALLIGTIVGSLAGYLGGAVDETLMRVTEFVLVLPMIYVVLALRAIMPLVLPNETVLLLMAGMLAAVGWPFVARGVRAIIATESQRDYVAAGRSLGAGHGRLFVRHLLPAARGFLLVQATLLLPAFILAEATLSFVGLGFAEPTPSWGSMLRDAANIRALADFPWLLSPALAIAVVVLGFNLLLDASGTNLMGALGGAPSPESPPKNLQPQLTSTSLPR